MWDGRPWLLPLEDGFAIGDLRFIRAPLADAWLSPLEDGFTVGDLRFVRAPPADTPRGKSSLRAVMASPRAVLAGILEEDGGPRLLPAAEAVNTVDG